MDKQQRCWELTFDDPVNVTEQPRQRSEHVVVILVDQPMSTEDVMHKVGPQNILSG